MAHLTEMHISDQQLSVIHWRAASLYERYGEALLTKDILNQLSIQQLLEWDRILSNRDGSQLSARLKLFKKQRKQILEVSEAFKRERKTQSGWISCFNEILKGYAQSKISFPSDVRSGGSIPFESLLRPFTEYAKSSLERRYKVPSIVSHEALDDHLLQLLKSLSKIASSCFYETFDAFRKTAKHAPTRNQDKLYRKFVQQQYAGSIIGFFEEYSALARLLTDTVEQWVEGTGIFFRRLSADIQHVNSHFFNNSEPDVLRKILSGVTARHTVEGEVHILVFSSGQKLIYKPRSAETDIVLQTIITWLNKSASNLLPLQTVHVLDRGVYSWHAYVPYTDCTTDLEVQRFYHRIGQLTALLQVLGSTDYHSGNLVAQGEHPVLVDNETLFSPFVRIDDTFTFTGDRYLDEGVLHGLSRSHFLLDTRQLIYRDAPSISGVFETQDRQRKVTYTHVNKDAMNKRSIMARWVGKHIPKLSRIKAEPTHYSKDLIQGYERTLAFIQKKTTTFFKVVENATGNFTTPIRVLIRATPYYEQLAARSVLAAHLRDGVHRSMVFEEMALFYIRGKVTSEVALLLWQELAMMERHLVPWFFIATRDIKIHSTSPAKKTSIITWSARTLFEMNLRRLDAAYIHTHVHMMRQYLSLRTKPSQTVRGTFMQNTIQTADHLRLCYESLYPWDQLKGAKQGQSIGISGRYGLGDGLGGILLLFAAIAKVAKKPEFAVTIARFVDPLDKQLRSGHHNLIEEIGYGGLNGIGSLIYVLTALGELLQEQKYIELAHRVSRERIPDSVRAADISLDNGLSGFLISLIKLNQLRPSDRLCQRIEELTSLILHQLRKRNHLSENPGYLSGDAGILYALCKQYERRPDELLLETISDLYEQLESEWKDRTQRLSQGPPSQNALSLYQGLAGWYVVQHYAIGVLKIQAERGRLIQGASKLLKIRTADSDQISIGIAGRCEPALLMRKISAQGLPEFTKAWSDRFTRLERHILTPRYISPTFYHGTAGILYQQLRLLKPSTLPSIIAFE
jgi:type 2 lantibiotic biosynthesis protein LanM